jgi:uncharacterized protein YfaS (alpha-2-macroglobulin family)
VLLKHLSFFIITFLACSIFSHAQSNTFEQRLAVMDSLNYADPREKIFVQTDKPYYRLKDTLWLKGYILTATDHVPNDSSRIAYVEVIDPTGSVIKRINPPCLYGMFDSYIALPTPDFTQGQYMLRAYTRHMRNWDDSLFYTQPFTLIDPASDAWKATIEQLSFENNRLKLSARLSETQLSLAGKRPINVRLLQEKSVPIPCLTMSMIKS